MKRTQIFVGKLYFEPEDGLIEDIMSIFYFLSNPLIQEYKMLLVKLVMIRVSTNTDSSRIIAQLFV